MVGVSPEVAIKIVTHEQILQLIRDLSAALGDDRKAREKETLNAKQVCEWLDWSPQTLRLMVDTGACPRPLPMPGLKPRWSRRSWIKWLETGGKR
jgi:hypothetical protein